MSSEPITAATIVFEPVDKQQMQYTGIILTSLGIGIAIGFFYAAFKKNER